jgi:predicted deacylase
MGVKKFLASWRLGVMAFNFLEETSMTVKRLLAITILIGVIAGAGSPAWSAKKNDKEIQEYLDQVDERIAREKKEARKRKWEDPKRKLRPYQTLDEINDELDGLLLAFPKLLTGGVYGKSVEDRDLRWIKVSTGPGDKAQVLVTANIHAQELAGGQMALALLRHLVKYQGRNVWVDDLLEKADVWIIPVMNPDEMEHAARAQSKWGITGFIRKNVNGVDLNRNFPYPTDGPDRVADSAGSPNEKSMTHRGPYPFSEPEIASFDAFVAEHDFVLSLNYHTSGGMILYPPGTYPDREVDSPLMEEIAYAYQERQFDKYAVYPGIDLYPTLGALDDYLYHHYGILSFTVEVGAHSEKRTLKTYNHTFSPIFWTYNVHEVEQEAANNVPGAMAMIEWAIKVHENPDMVKWQPPTELWVGETAPAQNAEEE